MSGSDEIAAARTITDKAAIEIQTLWRGHSTRKAFSLPKRTFVSDYHFIPVGNDPELSTCTPPLMHTTNKFALISTSTLKVIETGLEISGGLSIPKIYIVDYSKDVYDFWIAIKKIFSAKISLDELEGSVTRYIYNLPCFIESCIKTGCNPGNSHRFNVAAYLEKLIQKYTFKCVQKSIHNLCPILGSWEDTNLFFKLNNILSILDFKTRFVAPTNILACGTSFGDLRADDFFKSIEILKPIGQMHSDYCMSLNIPRNLYFFPQTASRAEIFTRLMEVPTPAASRPLASSFAIPIDLMTLLLLSSSRSPIPTSSSDISATLSPLPADPLMFFSSSDDCCSSSEGPGYK